MRLNCDRYSNQWACWQVNNLVVAKYSRVLQVLVVSNDIDRGTGTFEVVLPGLTVPYKTISRNDYLALFSKYLGNGCVECYNSNYVR